ncbi:hypothetical protein BH10PSE19_BH10PSE19_06090 [soil metagenome]
MWKADFRLALGAYLFKKDNPTLFEPFFKTCYTPDIHRQLLTILNASPDITPSFKKTLSAKFEHFLSRTLARNRYFTHYRVYQSTQETNFNKNKKEDLESENFKKIQNLGYYYLYMEANDSAGFLNKMANESLVATLDYPELIAGLWFCLDRQFFHGQCLVVDIKGKQSAPSMPPENKDSKNEKKEEPIQTKSTTTEMSIVTLLLDRLDQYQPSCDELLRPLVQGKNLFHLIFMHGDITIITRVFQLCLAPNTLWESRDETNKIPAAYWPENQSGPLPPSISKFANKATLIDFLLYLQRRKSEGASEDYYIRLDFLKKLIKTSGFSPSLNESWDAIDGYRLSLNRAGKLGKMIVLGNTVTKWNQSGGGASGPQMIEKERLVILAAFKEYHRQHPNILDGDLDKPIGWRPQNATATVPTVPTTTIPSLSLTSTSSMLSLS